MNRRLGNKTYQHVVENQAGNAQKAMGNFIHLPFTIAHSPLPIFSIGLSFRKKRSSLTIIIIIFVFFLTFSTGNHVFAQHYLMHPNLPIDTGYTLNSAYQKYIKDYPEISIARWTPKYELSINRDLVYQQYGKRAMHLDLFYRKDTKMHKPCVVIIHGGGWISGDKSMMETWALALADSGYVSALVEYRFSSEAKYPAAAIDITTAITWLSEHDKEYPIDPKNFVMLGGSAGGQLAALVGTTYSTDLYQNTALKANKKTNIAAIVDLDGVLAFLNPVSKEGMDKPGKPSAATRWFGLHFTADSSAWIEASALSHVDINTPPTIFIASKYPRFLAGNEEMRQIMHEKGIFSEYMRMDDAPHSFWLFNPWFESAFHHTLNFLEKVGFK